MKDAVSIVEVGPRDGLQSQNIALSPEDRFEYIRLLLEAGVRRVEAGAYVSPKWVPSMAGSSDVIKRCIREGYGEYISALVPNAKGLALALADGIGEIAVFGAASDSFCRKNINRTREESLADYKPVVEEALAGGIKVRAYVSTITHCPYEGPIEPEPVWQTAAAFLEMGAYEVSLGETIGRAVPADVRRLLEARPTGIPAAKLAGHFHDTYGTALANVMAALDHEIRTFDSSSGAIGGCPYAPGAAGNAGTEDLVYLLTGEGFETGLDMDKLVAASAFVESKLGRPLQSRSYLARRGEGATK